MPPGPFDADLDHEALWDLGNRLRALLEGGRRDVRAMAAGLGVEPELVVVALRQLRAGHAGRVRSCIYLGRITWWWEPEVAQLAVVGVEPLTSHNDAPSLRRKGKARRKKS